MHRWAAPPFGRSQIPKCIQPLWSRIPFFIFTEPVIVLPRRTPRGGFSYVFPDRKLPRRAAERP